MQDRQRGTLSTLEDEIHANMLIKEVKLNYGLLDLMATASELHRMLALDLDRRTAAAASWPKTPAMFMCQLRRLARMLAGNGLFVIIKRSMEARSITISARSERHQEVAFCRKRTLS
jgi:hypothetical protein